MKKVLTIIFCFSSFLLFAQEGRTLISLNGEWEFDQTKTAFPPAKYTRKIPVPGLIHLAVPRIDQYGNFFQKPHPAELPELLLLYNYTEELEGQARPPYASASSTISPLAMNYTPMYNWYRRIIKIDKKLSGQQLNLTIKKSQYVTMIYVNGIFMGRSVECYTPVELDITDAVKFGQENEILIQVGDRARLPSETAGSTDKEKLHYIPGIWDDVFISATGKLKVDKILFLPSLAKKSVTAKILIRNAYPSQMINFGVKDDPCRMEFVIKEKKSGKTVATKTVSEVSKRDNNTYFETEIPIKEPINAWSPESPFLYEGEVKVYERDRLSDVYSVKFGMRDFITRGSKFFWLNGSRYFLRGGNITLQRFFEDPDCGNLAWDREWVKKMLIDIPKTLHWNAMRICVGILPDFWYDLCDEYGIVLQNEWFYWQHHGWDEQIRKEYTNWVWSDGNHPCIVIWDAINENYHSYIGNDLIPELKKLDPTRIWDAGYMTAREMGSYDEMDEPHPYRAIATMAADKVAAFYETKPYNLGCLDYWDDWRKFLEAGVPQLVNEYGWVWLWRDGRPANASVHNYNYFLGANATPGQRREMQAYWLQLETEWIRAERSFAGVLAFCYLSNNYSVTGDWFINHIKDLELSPALKWFEHCFAPQAVFINIVDQRYMKHPTPYKPGSNLLFNVVGVNDFITPATGKVVLKLIDSNGKTVVQQDTDIQIDPYYKKTLPCMIELPREKGGYLLIAEYYPEGKNQPVISRRYLKVGDSKDEKYDFYEIKL